MKYVNTSILSLFVILLIIETSSGQQKKPDYQKMLRDIIPALGHEDVNQRRVPQEKWLELCLEAGAKVHEADRKAICLAMTQHLGEDVSVEARVFLLRQLERIGRTECIETVAKCLGDKNDRVWDGALRALMANPESAAGDAIRKAFNQVQTIPRSIQLMKALGYRGEVESVEILARYSMALNAEAMKTSVTALAQIDHEKAHAAIEKLFDGDLRPGDLTAYAQAYLTVAERIAKKGDNPKKAAEMFRRLEREKLKSPIRLAIAKGRLMTSRAGGESPVELVEEYFSKGDSGLVAVAAGHVRELDTKSIARLANRCSQFEKPVQLALLKALGPTRNHAALKGVLERVDSNDEEIRLAAIGALSGLADDKTVPRLVKLMESGGAESEVAAKSLERVHAAGVDAYIEDFANSALDINKRKRFLQILDRRRAVSAMKTFLREASHEDRSVRDLAVSILRRLASEKEVPALIEIGMAMKDRGEKDQVEKAIVTICQRIPDPGKRADPVISIYRNAPRSRQTLLLPLLGRLGSDDALVLVREAVKTQDDEAFLAAGVQALANWPNAQVTDDLMRVSTHSDQGLRIRSVRALARVVVLRDERTDQQRLGLLQKTMGKAERDQERDLILDRAKAIRTIETLRFVVPYLKNEKLQQRACRTVVDLAHHRGLREPNQEEFDKALVQVMEITSDKNLANRAKGYMTKQD